MNIIFPRGDLVKKFKGKGLGEEIFVQRFSGFLYKKLDDGEAGALLAKLFRYHQYHQDEKKAQATTQDILNLISDEKYQSYLSDSICV